jgi:putative acetyltransferase
MRREKIRMDVTIRPETGADTGAIRALAIRAFHGVPHADGNEQDVIDALREDGALAVSLVAEAADRVIGHIAFSPATAADGSGGWYTLGPVCVEPEFQRKGIGRQLVETGLAQLVARDASGCILLGHHGYYGRFGFQPAPELAPQGYPSEYFMILPLAVAQPNAAMDFHPAFDNSVS